MHKVLIVEDRHDTHERLREALDGRVEIIPAFTIAQAGELFAQHPDISAVVMDACVPGCDINTIPLVQEMRRTFAGPMIATSSSSLYQEQLMRAGCSHKAAKNDVPLVLLRILGIS